MHTESRSAKRSRNIIAPIVLAAIATAMALRADATVGGFGTPGSNHGDGLPMVSPNAHLEIRGTYFWADSKFEGTQRTEHGIVRDAVIPDMTFQLHLTGNWWLDMRVFSPFGAGTHYSESWQGAFHLVDAGLESINVTPGILWTNGKVAVSVAPQIQLMRKVAFSQAMFLPGIIGKIDGDDAWAVGAHLAIACKPSEDTELSLGYWSRMEHTLNNGTVHASLWNRANLGLGGTNIEITCPDVVAAKATYSITPAWSAWGLVEYTFWKDVLKDIRVKFDLPVLPDSVVQFDAKDTWFLQLGAKWRPEDSPWGVLATLGWGSNFTTDAHRQPSLIGGATWHAGTEVRYTWSSGVSSFLGVKCIKWADGASELPGAAIPYGFPFETMFGQLHGDYHATAYRVETGVSIPF